MDNALLQQNLEQIGLRHGEAKVYLSLLSLGTTSVKHIKEATGFHRTGIYDFLEQLITKGLVSYTTDHGTRMYTAVSPEKLQVMLEEKQTLLQSALPSLQALQQQHAINFGVEVQRGKEAIKNFLADILRVNQDYVCINVDEEMWEQKFPHITRQHIKKEIDQNITWKAVTKKGTFVYDMAHCEYRFLDQKYFGPVNCIIYGENIAMVVHNPLAVITIRNKDMAKAYRAHFDFLWGLAEAK